MEQNVSSSQLLHTNLDVWGFYIHNGYFSEPELAKLILVLEELQVFNYSSNVSTENLLQCSSKISDLANSEKIKRLLPMLSDNNDWVSIKAFILDKSKAYNWSIPWHQDLKIALKTMTPTPGYGNWSIEAGIPHVQPPVPVLEQMITVRIHLDECHLHNGAMNVIPDTHNRGILSKGEIGTIVINEPIWNCGVSKGGVMVFKPLLLHESPISDRIDPRRILQIEYARTGILAEGLTWH